MAAPAVSEIDPRTARQWLDGGQAALIDVREPDEHARERIAGAALHPLSRFDPARLPSGRLILHCQRGRRSLEAATRAAAAGRTDIASLAGGIEAWRAAGLPTAANAKAPLPIMRQVQIVAGSAVLAGTILAATVSPWFLILSGFFGAGLLFSGLSGTCGMAAMLSRLPWNRLGTSPPMKSTP
ncbi:MAG: rhodanese family protein [Phycisphaerales bacterium]